MRRRTRTRTSTERRPPGCTSVDGGWTVCRLRRTDTYWGCFCGTRYTWCTTGMRQCSGFRSSSFEVPAVSLLVIWPHELTADHLSLVQLRRLVHAQGAVCASNMKPWFTFFLSPSLTTYVIVTSERLPFIVASVSPFSASFHPLVLPCLPPPALPCPRVLGSHTHAHTSADRRTIFPVLLGTRIMRSKHKVKKCVTSYPALDGDHYPICCDFFRRAQLRPRDLTTQTNAPYVSIDPFHTHMSVLRPEGRHGGGIPRRQPYPAPHCPLFLYTLPTHRQSRHPDDPPSDVHDSLHSG